MGGVQTSAVPSELAQLTILTQGFFLRSNMLCGDLPTEVESWTSGKAVVKITTANSIGTPCPRTQEAALSALYHSTAGTTWDTKTNWLVSGTNACDAWYGVTCDGDGKVNNIDLSSNNLVSGRLLCASAAP